MIARFRQLFRSFAEVKAKTQHRKLSAYNNLIICLTMTLAFLNVISSLMGLAHTFFLASFT